MATGRVLGFVMLLAGIWLANVSGESFLNKFDVNLRSELSTVLQAAQVNFSVPNIVTETNSSTEFDMRGMRMLYSSTVAVINAIVRKDAYPEGFVIVEGGFPRFKDPAENWQMLVAHYAGPLAVIIIFALLVVVLPLAGLFWCCCYCCRYGRRRRPFDRKYDGCFKALFAIILIGLLTLFLFGVVCAFATDEHLDTNARTAPNSTRKAVQDVNNFINSTKVHANWLFVINWNELADKKLIGMLNDSGKTISSQLGEFSKAVSVTTLNKMVQQLDSVQDDLRTVQNVTAQLRYNAERLNSGLRKVKGQLLNTLAACEQPQCRRLQEKYKIGQLDTEIQYSQMPDVTELLNNVTQLLDSDIKREVAEGHKVFTSIQNGIQNSVNKNIPYVLDEVNNIGYRLSNLSKKVTTRLNQASEELRDQSESVLTQMDTAIADYGQYRRYVGLGVASALLVITTFIALGLICGICGKRPDVYGASDCCNKGAGSNWLLCGMCFTYLVGGIVCAVFLVYFIAGISAQRFICDPLEEPRGNLLFSDVEEFINIEYELFGENKDPELTLANIITRCHKGKTIYETLTLERVLDLESIKQQVRNEVSRVVESLKPQYPANARNVVILKPAAKVKLLQLADTGLSDFNFDRILQALETNITSLALDSLSSQLESTATELIGRPGFNQVTMELRDAAAMLSAYQRDIVQPMLNDTATLSNVAVSLQEGLKFNHSTLKEAVTNLLQESQDAEVFLNTQGPTLIYNLTEELASTVADSINGYFTYVTNALRNDVGRCEPLSHAFNSTRTTYCEKILMPVNGYWISIAWCVFLFVPMLVVAQRLARLYLHVDPYPGPIVEASYKADKRSRRELPAASGEGRARDLAAGTPPAVDSHHTRRYNDMAPNNSITNSVYGNEEQNPYESIRDRRYISNKSNGYYNGKDFREFWQTGFSSLHRVDARTNQNAQNSNVNNFKLPSTKSNGYYNGKDVKEFWQHGLQPLANSSTLGGGPAPLPRPY